MAPDTLGPVLIVLAAFGAMAFALRYRREDSVRRFGAELVDAMAREAEAKTKQVAVRWVAGVVAALGVSALGVQVASLAMSPVGTHTVFNDISAGGGANPAIDVAYDWGTATGTTDNAVLDGGQLYTRTNSYSGMGVWPRADSLPGAPPHWPTNMVRLSYSGESSHLIGTGTSETDPVLTAPATGDSVGFRILFHAPNMDCSTDNIGTNHGFQSNIGTIEQFLHVICTGSQSSGNIIAGFGIQPGGTTPTISGLSYRATLTTSNFYRLEWLIGRPTSGQTQLLRARIVDAATGLVVADSDDLLDTNSDALSAERPVATYASFVFAFQTYLFGSSGQLGATGTPCCVWFGGFAHAVNEYPGPFVAGEG